MLCCYSLSSNTHVFASPLLFCLSMLCVYFYWTNIFFYVVFLNTTLCHLTIYFYFLISMNAFWLSSVAYIHCVWVDCCIVFLYDIFRSFVWVKHISLFNSYASIWIIFLTKFYYFAYKTSTYIVVSTWATNVRWLLIVSEL